MWRGGAAPGQPGSSGGAHTASGRKGELLEVTITACRKAKAGCDEGRVLPSRLVNSGSTEEFELVFKGEAIRFPADRPPAFGGGALVGGGAPSPRRGRAPGYPGGGRTPCPDRHRRGWAPPPQPPGLSLPPPGLPLQHTPNRLAAVSFYLILLLKLWHYLQWQWYRPAQDPLKQICLQVKSKKYFDS